MTNKYSDEEVNNFLERAQEIGIGRAQKELGYPKSWATAKDWATSRGVEVNIDQLKQRSKEFHQWYETEELLIVAQEGFQVVMDKLEDRDNLESDDIKKLSESFQKFTNSWLLLKNKATAISESRQSDNTIEIMDMLEKEIAKNADTDYMSHSESNTNDDEDINSQ